MMNEFESYGATPVHDHDGLRFEVLRKGEPLFETYSVIAIPSVSELNSMNEEGYAFKLDGKKATLKQIISYVEDMTKGFMKPDKPVATKGKIHCITTDEWFATQSEAARKYGIDSALVSDSIKVNRPRKGYLFEKVDV